jgi:hypothetical protein
MDPGLVSCQRNKLVRISIWSNISILNREELVRLAKLAKTGSWYIWLDNKYYTEVPAECQPDYP